MFVEDAVKWIRQCAWCRKVADANGAFTQPSSTIVPNATYGICDLCLDDVRARRAKPGEFWRLR